jgi:cardiolipin synthase
VISKINTGVQIVYVLGLVASLGLRFPPQPVIVTLAAAVFVTTMVSGIDYIITYSRRAAEVARARRV